MSILVKYLHSAPASVLSYSLEPPGVLVWHKCLTTNFVITGLNTNVCSHIHLTDIDHGAATDGVLVEYDVNEPTMGEKLASITLQDNGKTNSLEIEESPPHAKPPSADSVNILLKQALRADDRALLLDCLYTQDEKVVFSALDMLMLNFTYRRFTLVRNRLLLCSPKSWVLTSFHICFQ